MSDTTDTTPGTPDAAEPVLRVVSGDPTPEELAALLLVVAAAGGGGEAPAPAPRRSMWGHPVSRLRQERPLGHTLGWRTSLR